MPELINLRPLPRPTAKTTAAATAPQPPQPQPLNQHPQWAPFVTQLARTLLHPNPHLQPEIYALLEYADTL